MRRTKSLGFSFFRLDAPEADPRISGCYCLQSCIPDPDRHSIRSGSSQPKTNGERTNASGLLYFAPVLLAITLASQGRFHATLFTRFQIIRVTLYFLDDVLLLDFPLEAPQSILEGFTLLKSNFSHE